MSIGRRCPAVKRAMDIAAATVGLLLLLPLLLIVAAAIKLTSRGPVLFCQERIGRRFRPFRIYKFRTMVQDAPMRGGTITVGDDPRITLAPPIARRLARWAWPLCRLREKVPLLCTHYLGAIRKVGPETRRPFGGQAEDRKQVHDIVHERSIS